MFKSKNSLQSKLEQNSLPSFESPASFESLPRFDSKSQLGSHTAMIAGIVVGAAAFGLLAASYFFTRSGMPKFPPRRAQWQSESTSPQIARFESEGGNVPEVKPIQPKH